MDILQYMKRKADLKSLMTGAGTVFAGTAAAVIRGNMEVLAASVCLIFVLFTQVGCNLYRYYHLMRNAGNEGQKRFSLDAVDHSPMALRLLREGSTACMIVSLTLGLTLMTMAEGIWWSLVVGAIIYGSVYVMSMGPFAGRKWVSLLLTFLLFGPVGVMGTALLQFQHEAAHTLWGLYDMAPSVFMGVSMGFLACSFHLVLGCYNSSIDPNPQNNGCVRTITNRYLPWYVALCGVLSFATAVAMVYYCGLQRPLIALVPAVPSLALNTHIALNLYKGGIVGLRHYNTLAQLNFLLTGFLYFVVWWAIGSPDDSLRVIIP